MSLSNTEKKENLSEPAQVLLEQYKHYREDGIVEIKEPLADTDDDKDEHKSNATHSNSKKNAAEIAQKVMSRQKQKRSTIITDLPAKPKQQPQNNSAAQRTNSSVMGMDESWWDEITKEESRFVNDYKHKVNNIAMMRQYEAHKDASPFNATESDASLQRNWEEYLWQESIQKQEQYLQQKEQKEARKAKQSKKASERATSSKTSVNADSASKAAGKTSQKKKKKLKLPKKQQYGNLVGFFNKPKSKTNPSTVSAGKPTVNAKQSTPSKADSVKSTEKKANSASNPYLDPELMKSFGDFTPDKNQSFEKKFDLKKQAVVQSEPTIIESNEFKSMIITPDESHSSPSSNATALNAPTSILKKKNQTRNGAKKKVRFDDQVKPSQTNKQQQTKSKPKQKQRDTPTLPAFNGQVFERRAPDLVYMNDADGDDHEEPQLQSVWRRKNGAKQKSAPIPPQPAPIISHEKTSLFKKRRERHDAFYETEETDEQDDDDMPSSKPPSMFSNVLHSKRENKEESKEEEEEKDDEKQQETTIAASNKPKQDIVLLFLDVDGVLNCTYSPSLSRSHVLRIRTILDKTPNCKICISSSWRVLASNRKRLLAGLRQLADIDVDNVVIGQTPRIPKDPLFCRPEEIQRYLQTNEYLRANFNVIRWCAIDDVPLDTINRDYSDFMKNHFVKTNAAKGMTDDDMQRVIAMLNGIDEAELERRKQQKREEKQKRKEQQKLERQKKRAQKEEIKLLFLDVDGVLNYRGFDDHGVNGALSLEHLQRLKKIIDCTDCRIVLSASWRQIPSAREQLLRQLAAKVDIDIGKYVIGDTPALGSVLKKPLEICEYLESVKHRFRIVSWMAVDDMPLNKMGNTNTKEILKGHFVKTNVDVGLSENNVLTAISILNGVQK